MLDRGHGISEDVAAKVFVPFYTTRKQGSGVGLAFSRQVMIAHGGTITFSQPGWRRHLFYIEFLIDSNPPRTTDRSTVQLNGRKTQAERRPFSR